MRSALGLTGPVQAQKSPAERRAIWVQYRGKSAAGHKTARYVLAQPSHTENTPAASFVLLNAILLTRAPEGPPPRLQPTFSWACPQWRTFVPAVFTASVHPCVHSAGRVGFGYPVPFSPLPAPSERYRQRLHWINRSLIVLCAPVLAATQNRVYIIIVLPELVNPQPLLSAACIVGVTMMCDKEKKG